MLLEGVEKTSGRSPSNGTERSGRTTAGGSQALERRGIETDSTIARDPSAHRRRASSTWCSLSPDGSRLYSGDRAGVIREWDARKAIELRRWNAGGWVQDLALSPDGTRVAATGPAGIARVIDLNANRVALDINLASAYGNGIAFAESSPFLLTSDGDGNVRTWHRDTGMQIGLPMRLSGEVTKIRFRPDSDQFAVPAGDAIFLCSAADPPYDVVTAGYGRRLRGLDISPGAIKSLSATTSGFELFDTITRRRLQRVDRPRSATHDPLRPET